MHGLSALKVFFRDFLKKPQVVESFKFPRQPYKPKHFLIKEQVQQFYGYLDSPKEQALFLLYASTGLRRNEVLSLSLDNIDFTARMIIPNSHDGETKKAWLSFYNGEAEQALNQYLATKKASRSVRVFPMPRTEEHQLWKTAKEQTGLNITPQRLREWFCSEMLRLGASDTYIDAFCGRTSKSVLAKHYTDYSPQNLKHIYAKANLKILS